MPNSSHLSTAMHVILSIPTFASPIRSNLPPSASGSRLKKTSTHAPLVLSSTPMLLLALAPVFGTLRRCSPLSEPTKSVVGEGDDSAPRQRRLSQRKCRTGPPQRRNCLGTNFAPSSSMAKIRTPDSTDPPPQGLQSNPRFDTKTSVAVAYNSADACTAHRSSSSSENSPDR